MLGFLDELETPDGEAVSLYLPPGLSIPEIEELINKIPVPPTTTPDIVHLIGISPTGSVLFWGKSRKCLVLPPFPIKDKFLSSGYDSEPLRSILNKNFSTALVLVRLGAYAIGICRGEELIISKTGTGLVHARHKKGGSSQQRFQRHRDNQIHHFLARVCGHLQEHLEPHASSLDYLVYGGSRTTLDSLRKLCPFLRQFENRTLPPLLDIPKPRSAVLKTAVSTVWSTTINEWYDNEIPDIEISPAEV